MPRGVRAGGSHARQVLYEFDRFAVDVRAEGEPGSVRVSLAGQILDRTHPPRRLSGRDVRLHQAGRPVAQTTTNEHGEFQLSFEAAADLWISIEVDGATLAMAGFSGSPAGPSGSPASSVNGPSPGDPSTGKRCWLEDRGLLDWRPS